MCETDTREQNVFTLARPAFVTVQLFSVFLSSLFLSVYWFVCFVVVIIFVLFFSRLVVVCNGANKTKTKN